MLAAVNLAELEETLSRPTPTVVETLRGIDGDVVILGAGGKMGPSLARMAKRAIDLSGSPNAVHAVSRYTDQTMRAPLEDLGSARPGGACSGPGGAPADGRCQDGPRGRRGGNKLVHVQL